jgi:hypothetical protein
MWGRRYAYDTASQLARSAPYGWPATLTLLLSSGDFRLSGIGVSAKPDVTSVLRNVLRQGDVLVVWKLDRLARSLKELITTAEELEEQGSSLVSLTESIDTTTPGGMLVFHVDLSVFPQPFPNEFAGHIVENHKVVTRDKAVVNGALGVGQIFLRIVADRLETPFFCSLSACKRHWNENWARAGRAVTPLRYQYALSKRWMPLEKSCLARLLPSPRSMNVMPCLAASLIMCHINSRPGENSFAAGS